MHNGSQDMRELGRRGGRAIPKAKRADAGRETLREFLRREVDPSAVWAAIQSSLASSNERDKLAGAKLLLGELYEPAVEREREEQAEVARSRERLLLEVEKIGAKRTLAVLAERGVIRPRVALAGSRDGPFVGVVKFELRELAEWAAVWAPAAVAVSDVACGGCGKAGVRLVKEGESVDCEAVYCETCKSR